ncbi:GNAT family N-acetyltransferase [Aureisphaera galaxeae]|uniref:GNAT family N-acetyltransferase n=1 Tax=Aureisphaera galaxeae TaxID=1538023 RepID=UPI0023509D6C|nr:GNAT family N-acetyltransferase [Aureisphaera galaxeae]MDC8006003.1 GNAT family N-acetyltransferase [Aureisphaera galaxeae]
MDIQIRKATPKDMGDVLDLITELAIFEKEPDGVKISVEDLEVAGFGENPMYTCFVAEFENEIMGMALIYFRFSTWVGKTVHLEDLVVREKMRGKGVGNLLYKEVMKFAREEGVKRVNWMVLGWNKGAIKFYERTGAKVQDDWWQVEMDEEGIKNFVDNN